MLTPVYALAAATQVPPLIAPGAQALLNRNNKVPTVSPLLGQAPYATSSGLIDWGQNLAANLDAVGRYGAGAYGVAKGLELQADGTSLSYTVTAGASILDSEVPLAADVVRAADPGVYSWIWQTAPSGAIQVGTGSNPNLVPPAPAPIAAFLGRIDATSGAISAIDYSGRLSLRPFPWRQTGDFGTPGDSPPPSFAFFHRTASGFYVWDGVAYTFLGTTASAPTNIGISSLLVQLGAVAALQDTADARFRRLLFHYVNTLGEIPPGLETEFDLAAAQA